MPFVRPQVAPFQRTASITTGFLRYFMFAPAQPAPTAAGCPPGPPGTAAPAPPGWPVRSGGPGSPVGGRGRRWRSGDAVNSCNSVPSGRYTHKHPHRRAGPVVPVERRPVRRRRARSAGRTATCPVTVMPSPALGGVTPSARCPTGGDRFRVLDGGVPVGSQSTTSAVPSGRYLAAARPGGRRRRKVASVRRGTWCSTTRRHDVPLGRLGRTRSRPRRPRAP